MSPPRSEDQAEREAATAAILDRSEAMAEEFEVALQESEELLARLRKDRSRKDQ